MMGTDTRRLTGASARSRASQFHRNSETLAQSGVWSQHLVDVPYPKVMLPVGRSGRYVRIQLSYTNYLSLAEVKVFATA